MSVNRAWVLEHRPEGSVRTGDFGYRERDFAPPDLAEGEILVRPRIISCAPTIRNWMNAPSRSYRGAIAIGDPIRGMAAVEVIASHHPGFPVGIWATAVAPWQDYAVLRPDDAPVPITPLPQDVEPVEAMTLYSPNSMTAYFGLFAIGEAQPGMTVLVSGAAGSVGAMVCQMARIAGCRVVALAGGAEKCGWLERECGADVAIDYRTADLLLALRTACPDGINVFFDNVGGSILDAAIDQMAPRGRIALCGQISAYDSHVPAAGPSDMMKLVYGRIRMEGFLVGEFVDRYEEAIASIRQWRDAGLLKIRLDLRHGFDSLPNAFVDVFAGRNAGTLVVRI